MITHQIIGDDMQAVILTLREDVKRDFGGAIGARGDLIGGDR